MLSILRQGALQMPQHDSGIYGDMLKYVAMHNQVVPFTSQIMRLGEVEFPHIEITVIQLR